jgi:hypothetical protein
MSDIFQLINVGFAPLIMSISDMLLLFYISGGNREFTRKNKKWYFWFFVWLFIMIFSQLVFSGQTNPQANFLVFYIIHFFILLFFSDQCTDAPLSYRSYLVILSVLAFDICLILLIGLSVSIFQISFITEGTFIERVISHMFLLGMKMIAAYTIKKAVKRHFFNVRNVFQVLIIMLPALPYFVLRNYAYFFNINPVDTPLIILYLNVLFGISAMTNMIIGEHLFYQIRQHERVQIEKLAKKQYDNLLCNLKSIDTVNQKYHDLRHIIRGIDAMDSLEEVKSSIKSIEKEIQNYELIFNTGNKTLDVIFTDRTQEANNKNIRLHIHADGQGWEIVSDIDIATIFGNALDNAIESVENGHITDSRLINVRVGRVNEMLIARFENPFFHKLERSQSKYISTKQDPDHHGFGLQSIEMIVENYKGEMDIKTEGGTFILTVIIPA